MRKLSFILIAVLTVFMFMGLAVSAQEPAVEVYGVKITVNGLDNAKDFFIAKGEFDSYKEIKNNGYIVRVTESKIAEKSSYTYTVSSPGMHTVLVRYKDGREYIFHKELTVDEPELITNGLQVTVKNIPDVKVIRTAYGSYNTPGETKRAEGSRSYSGKSDIKGASEYKIQYRSEGRVTIAVEYNNGYIKIFHYDVTKKSPTLTRNGNSITFGSLDGLVMIRYAIGEYSSSSEIKAAGGKVIKPADDPTITVSDLAEGRYTFSVQYDDESYNYYVIDIAAEAARILCFGDSLTHGILTTWDPIADYPYPRRLSQLTGMETKNYGIGAEAAEIIAMRQGGLPIIVKPTVIAADTASVQIEVTDENGWLTRLMMFGDAGVNPVELGGVKGTLSRYGDSYYFTRLESGQGVVLDSYTRLYTHAMTDKRDNDILVIWSGHNNDYNIHQAGELISIIDKMIEYHGNDRYIVVGMTAERRAPAYKEINAELKEKYGAHFVDAQPYLADPQRLTELSITPTQKDLEYLSYGWTPPSLLAADDLHLNQAGYDIIAKLVSEKITELGFTVYPIDTDNKAYTLTLDAGNGEVYTYPANTGDNYYDIIPELPDPTREGYRFMGWQNSYGYKIGQPQYVRDYYRYYEDITFNAIWQEDITYTITLDPMGGSMDAGFNTTYQIYNGEYYYQAMGDFPTASRRGYTFGGWYIAEYNFLLDSNSYYTNWFSVYKDCTFTAVWIESEPAYTITLDPMDGVMDEGFSTAYSIFHGEHYNEAMGTYPTASREGYTFGGWYIAEYNYTLTPTNFYYDWYAIYKDCTFTAIWKSE